MSTPAQQALDIATTLEGELSNSPAVAGTPGFEQQVLAAIQLLAEAVIGTNPSIDSVDAGADTNVDVATTTPVATPDGA
jgi:hypothetical protein